MRLTSPVQGLARTTTRDVEVGETTIPAALAWGKAELAAAGFAPIDYLTICDALDLTPVDTLERPARVLTAAWLGKTRLIDNLALEAG